MRIIVADDSVVIRDRLMIVISEIPGVEIIGTAASGPEAVERFERLRPDLTVLDLKMPGGGGIDALSRIKKIDPSSTVVILTNYPDEQYRQLCRARGADFFLDKSTEFERIPEVIGQLMAARSRDDNGSLEPSASED